MSDSKRSLFSSSSSSFLLKSPHRSPMRGRENASSSFLNVTPTKKIKKNDGNKEHGNALQIFLRVRPLKSTETDSCVEVDGNQITLRPPTARNQTKLFDFQKVFDENCTQEEVFNESFLKLIPALGEGRDMLLFAYGVTSAGKTFTIEGTNSNPGILNRALTTILSQMNGPLSMYTKLTVSCFEIFNEKIFDLLAQNSNSNKSKKLSPRGECKNQLTLGRYSDGRTSVEGASEWAISNESQISDLLLKANSERHKAETTFNHNSSRSHVVFRIILHREHHLPVFVSIVDLAGCERTKTLGDDRMKESVNINKSMLVLGKCIRSLATKQSAVPYRESLITRLFKDFFESPGKCAVAAVIVNITPGVEQFEDTAFSLSFAVDASEVYTTTAIDESLLDDAFDIPTPNYGAVKSDVLAQVQKYLDSVEHCYQEQVTQLMERTRCGNRLYAEMSDTVPREQYVALQKENNELREQLNAALKKIRELSSGNEI
ncbi:Kinesin motor domain containing protein [Trichomonas vaginalis G3]|uniref:Kinesin motor domain containing protein n=1 Tax=Trichomonas vaginalis (strain ATCC PRA-98 / G3) TaxID=412133 RepID=A2E0J1_TRIV3|nr:ATP-dependent microtubule motor activity, plus-end-directed [Trichomonas vaginalis G3]EAY13871.1 Kinesin motor domain containing protein [Trichomonas vaginalis G3]KAI5520427.1 ATP-dependent microtubule motor activity, plus-end-directed [Trichomonas vaginalis G3]|eukprot:XP_001326094.1 Kinesin motor domain containing protein [Trichomonas vaginalis G3]